MKTRKSWFMKPLLVASLGCLMAFAVACGDDDDDNPAPNGGTKNTAGSSGKSTGGSNSNAGKSGGNNGGAGNETSDAGDGPGPQPMGGEAGTGSGGAPVDCVDEDDRSCYRCAPKSAEQHYNACPTDGCRAFDNSALTSLVDGKLPDL
jgi:hypothetical protein